MTLPHEVNEVQHATNTFGVVVTPALPAASIKALVALAKSRPGELTYASAGIGNLTHLAGERFSQAAGIKMLHVPYKGTTPAQARRTRSPPSSGRKPRSGRR